MSLTRRDAFATLLTAASVGIYIAHLRAADGSVGSSTRATTAVVLVIGLAVCALGQAGDLYARDGDNAMAVLGAWMSLIGVFALLAAVTGIALGAQSALLALIVASAVLWLAATTRHLLTTEPVSRPPDRREPGTAPPPWYPEAPVDEGYPASTQSSRPVAPGPRTNEAVEPEARAHEAPIRGGRR